VTEKLDLPTNCKYSSPDGFSKNFFGNCCEEKNALCICRSMCVFTTRTSRSADRIMTAVCIQLTA